MKIFYEKANKLWCQKHKVALSLNDTRHKSSGSTENSKILLIFFSLKALIIRPLDRPSITASDWPMTLRGRGT